MCAASGGARWCGRLADICGNKQKKAVGMKVGLIGCGNISRAYLLNGKVFKQSSICKCADLKKEAAQARASEFGMEAMSVDQLLADDEIEAVLNLTTPESHVSVNMAALEAGKHVYCEKPFALNREDGRKVMQLAESKGLRVGCAPDTFLGGGHQMCRKLVSGGLIGKVVSGVAFMMCHGHESWHPAPGFYYRKGGGPLFDMGPYYITALVNILGPVKRVCAMSTRSTDLRAGLKVNAGKTFPVEIDTHVTALLEFSSGAFITLITSFDVWKHSNLPNIELYGTDGSLHVPDPNCFNGQISLFKGGLSSDWAPIDNVFRYNDNMRGIGLADMCDAIRLGRRHRCCGELAFHVLDVMCSICDSAETGCFTDVASACEQPAPLDERLTEGKLDLE